jgi:hypothetical protein
MELEIKRERITDSVNKGLTAGKDPEDCRERRQDRVKRMGLPQGLQPGRRRTVRLMSKAFTYEGGPRDKETNRAEEVDFPEIHSGGEYRWSGFSHGIGSRGPDDDLPDADRATAVWYPKEPE